MIAQCSDELARIESEAEAALLQILEENRNRDNIYYLVIVEIFCLLMKHWDHFSAKYDDDTEVAFTYITRHKNKLV